MNEFAQGDIVKITIEGARVVGEGYDERYQSAWLRVALAINGDEAHGKLHLGAQGLTVERVAPPEWPPQPGDVWGSDGGGRWFAAQHVADFDNPADFAGCNSDGWRVVLVPLSIGPYGEDPQRPEAVSSHVGGLFLIHREEAGR